MRGGGEEVRLAWHILALVIPKENVQLIYSAYKLQPVVGICRKQEHPRMMILSQLAVWHRLLAACLKAKAAGVTYQGAAPFVRATYQPHHRKLSSLPFKTNRNPKRRN